MKNENQPAFPISEEQTDRIDVGVKIYTGLTKREYFAAKALQGLLTIYDNNELNPTVPNRGNAIYMAEMAVIAADALIEQLNKKP